MVERGTTRTAFSLRALWKSTHPGCAAGPSGVKTGGLHRKCGRTRFSARFQGFELISRAIHPMSPLPGLGSKP